MILATLNAVSDEHRVNERHVQTLYMTVGNFNMTALCRVAQSQADTAERIIVENTGYAQVRAVFTENKRAFIEIMLRKKIFDLQIIIVIVVFKSGIPASVYGSPLRACVDSKTVVTVVRGLTLAANLISAFASTRSSPLP